MTALFHLPYCLEKVFSLFSNILSIFSPGIIVSTKLLKTALYLNVNSKYPCLLSGFNEKRFSTTPFRSMFDIDFYKQNLSYLCGSRLFLLFRILLDEVV